MSPFVDEGASTSPHRVGHPFGHMIWTTNFRDARESNQSLHAKQSAKHSRVDNFFGALGFRDVTAAKTDGMAQPRPVHRLGHFLSFDHRVSERFLAKNMFPRGDGLQHYLFMRMVSGVDEDQI